jgi:hypothetical protein
MPDKQTPPGCLNCRWSRPILEAEVPSKYFSPKELSKCELHNVIVWESRLHLCSELSSTSGEAQPAIELKGILVNQIYAWLEIKYRVLASPDQLHVYYELTPIASLDAFSKLTTIQKAARYRDLHFSGWMRLKQKSSEAIEEAAMYRKRYGRRNQKRQ